MRTDFTLCFPGRLLCRISPRFHLRMICRAIELEPYVWQRAFALGRINSLPGKRTRGNGKTTAVMLRLLMLPPGAPQKQAENILASDPDWQPVKLQSFCAGYARLYLRLQIDCCAHGIPVSNLENTVFRKYLCK